MWNRETEGVNGLAVLVGRTIAEIRMDETALIFTDTEGQVFGFGVEGGCCSYSYFHDFHHPDRLLYGNPITAVEEIPLDDDETDDTAACVACYGFRFTVEDYFLGPISAVFSFRNASNGYYGGWLTRLSAEDVARLNLDDIDVITETVLEI